MADQVAPDAGSTWDRRPDPPLTEAISFQSASDGFALATLGAADGCRIAHTTDGGASWSAPVDGAVKGGNCAGAVFVDRATGYVPVPGRVYRTSDPEAVSPSPPAGRSRTGGSAFQGRLPAAA